MICPKYRRSLIPHLNFADFQAPRRETKNKLHKLTDIVLIVLCAVQSGIEDWVGMEGLCRRKRSVVPDVFGVTERYSHDTLSNVLGRLNPKAFADAFQRWVNAALPSLSGQQVCLDGKTLRGSRERDKALHLMSAFATEAR